MARVEQVEIQILHVALSFFPHTISIGGCDVRRYSCHLG
jgi:hypothetical protein